MYEKVKRSVILLITGVILVSCNFPAMLNVQQPEDSDPTVYSQTKTHEVSPSETLEPKPQPATLGLTIQLIEQSLFEDGDEPRYEIDGVWPNLVGPEPHVVVFNNESNRIVDAAKEGFLLAVTDGQGGMAGQGEPPLSYLTFNYDLTYYDQRLLSFYLTFDQYIAMSAHPFPFSHSLNFDAQNSAFLSLESLFLSEMDYVNVIGSLIDPILNDKGFGYQVGTASDVMQTRENWSLLEEGLRINFDVYEVAPYAAGPQFVLIPWNDLSELIDPNGPAAGFLD